MQLMGDEDQNILNTIKKDYQKSEDCCLEMFSQWREYSNATWQNVIDALNSNAVRKFTLAEELMQRFGMRCACKHACTFCVCVYVCVSNIVVNP